MNAAPSATTLNTVQGSAPYLTFDGGITKATKTSALLSITLSDGTTYTQDSNPSSVSNPIMLPVAGQSINDVVTFIPKDKDTITLSKLIDYNYHRDDNSDVLEQATGELSMSITDKYNKLVNRRDVLNGCRAPYEVVLRTTHASLKTQYGDPSETNFNASTAIYYISPKIETPYSCFVKPNLHYGFGIQPEWNSENGFKVQSLSEPKKNFPRTGFNGAFFDIRIAGTTPESVIAATGIAITQGGVTATLTAQSDSEVRITLTGPNDANAGGIFTPSTFTIKSSSTNDIYSFALSKWFVAKPVIPIEYSVIQTYCSDLTGNYRVPSVSEYTNANGVEWSGGLAGWKQLNYARAIGNGKQKIAVLGDDGVGGLFTEWGDTSNRDYYTESDFSSRYYWGVEPYIDGKFMLVNSGSGTVNASLATHPVMAACVSP